MNSLEREQKYKEWLQQPLTRDILAKCGIFKRTRRPKRKGDLKQNKIFRTYNKLFIRLTYDKDYYKGEFNRINGAMTLIY